MPKFTTWSSLRLGAAILIFLSTLTACIGGASNTTGDTVRVIGFIDGGATINGSVVDGPVIGAGITIRDAAGRQLATAISDSNASFTAHIPDRAPLPLTITASGGINIVTMTVPTFDLVSVVMNPGDGTVNINPFTTLIVKTAQARPGGLSHENLSIATEAVLENFNAGLDTSLLPDPITTPITKQNVATLVKASEVLAEIIRRSQQALTGAGIGISENAVINSLAGDMTDGILDGRGTPAADPRLTDTVLVTSAQVLIDALMNTLEVNSVPAAVLLDTAIGVVIPTATQKTADLRVNAEILRNARTALDAAMRIAPSAALSNINTIVNAIAVGSSSAAIAMVLPTDSGTALNPAIAQATSGTGGSGGAGVIENPPAGGNSPPEPVDNVILTLTWKPNPGTVDGYIVYFGPSANAVNHETTDIKAFAGSFDPASPLIQYDSWFDLALKPGDQACFKLRAYNADGISDWSSPVCSIIPQST